MVRKRGEGRQQEAGAAVGLLGVVEASQALPLLVFFSGPSLLILASGFFQTGPFRDLQAMSF